MSVSLIYDLAPIGSIIAWSNGKPCPNEDFRRKVIRWKKSNSQGRLAQKFGPHILGNNASPPWFIMQQVEVYDSLASLHEPISRSISTQVWHSK